MSLTYLEAIREAQAHALRDDPRVFIYGQDVGAFGGAFKATKNLAKEFPGRVLMRRFRRRNGRPGRRRGNRRNAADHRNAVRGFCHRRLQSNRQPGRDIFLAHECSVPDHRSPSVRRHVRRRTVSQANASRPFTPIIPALSCSTPATVEDAYSMLLESRCARRPGDFLRAQISLLPSQGGKIAERSAAPSARRASPAKAAT